MRTNDIECSNANLRIRSHCSCVIFGLEVLIADRAWVFTHYSISNKSIFKKLTRNIQVCDNNQMLVVIWYLMSVAIEVARQKQRCSFGHDNGAHTDICVYSMLSSNARHGGGKRMKPCNRLVSPGQRYCGIHIPRNSGVVEQCIDETVVPVQASDPKDDVSISTVKCCKNAKVAVQETTKIRSFIRKSLLQRAYARNIFPECIFSRTFDWTDDRTVHVRVHPPDFSAVTITMTAGRGGENAGRKWKKQKEQEASIVAHVAAYMRFAELGDRYSGGLVVLEVGAGSGTLSRALCPYLPERSVVCCIERSHYNHKRECKDDSRSIRTVRIQMDLHDMDISAVLHQCTGSSHGDAQADAADADGDGDADVRVHGDTAMTAASRRGVLIVGKHVCGVATDYVLEAVHRWKKMTMAMKKNDETVHNDHDDDDDKGDDMDLVGMCIATCCHSCCIASHLREMRDHVRHHDEHDDDDDHDDEVIARSGLFHHVNVPERSDVADADACASVRHDRDHDHYGDVAISDCAACRAATGWMCKRYIDVQRAHYVHTVTGLQVNFNIMTVCVCVYECALCIPS